MSDLRVDAPAEVRFLFQESRKRSTGALAVSLGIHFAMFGLAVWVALNPSVAPQTMQAIDKLSDQIVWLDVPGPGGGGGGGGNQKAEPVKQVELKGKEKITVPVGEAARPAAAQGEATRRSHSEPDHPCADARVCRSRSGGGDGGHSNIGFPGTGHRRRRRNGRRHRHRSGTRIRVLATDGAAEPAAAHFDLATASRRRAC